MVGGCYGSRGALGAADGPELGEGRGTHDGRLIDTLAGVDVVDAPVGGDGPFLCDD